MKAVYILDRQDGDKWLAPSVGLNGMVRPSAIPHSTQQLYCDNRQAWRRWTDELASHYRGSMIIEPDFMSSLTFDAPTHVYRYNGVHVPNITSIVPSDYSHVDPAVLERARIRGHRVHRLTELFDKKLQIDWALIAAWQLEGWLESWINVCRDYEIEFEPEDVERRLYHPIAQYAGTGDRPRAWIKPPNQKRRLATIEIKTIAKMDENVQLQVGGQRYAENYRARKLGIPEIEEGWGIQLKGDGTYGKPCHYTAKRHITVFLSYLDTLKWEVEHGKRKLQVQSGRNGAGANTSTNATRRRERG